MTDLDSSGRPDSRAEQPAGVQLRRSPLTDPRALVVSLAIHVTLLMVASVFVFRAVTPRETPAPNRSMAAELEPTDNRADVDAIRGGGGEPVSDSAELSADRGSQAAPTRDPALDALLSEILPTRNSAEPLRQIIPGPSTTVSGLLSGASLGEGGGRGEGSGGGVGQATGPGTEFFGMRDRGASYAYVIDRSGSMFARSSLDVAKRELLASLAQVPPEARFAVIFYNLDATVFTDPSGHAGMMMATPDNKVRVKTLLNGVPPDGGTDHMRALHAAIAMHPEVIFFLTDADMMSRQEVAEILTIVGKTRIQAVEFGLTSSFGGSAALRSLAKATGGSYRYIDVKTFGGR